MSDGETMGSRERTTIGIVAPETDPGHIVEAVTDAGGVADIGSVDIAADVDVVVAVGDVALSALTRETVSTPILPVGVEGIESSSLDTIRTTIERVLTGEFETRNRPLVRVETGERSGHALFDVSLVTAEQASISEFTVEMLASDAMGVDEPVARVRADGVVVATPVGSRGYARAAGGPVVVPGSDVFSVIPISPFATDPDHWVLPLSGLSLTVERDETEVTVSVDGHALCTVAPGTTVRLVRDGSLSLVVSEPHK